MKTNHFINEGICTDQGYAGKKKVRGRGCKEIFSEFRRSIYNCLKVSEGAKQFFSIKYTTLAGKN